MQSTITTIGSMATWANDVLEKVGFSKLDSQVLVCHALGISSAQLITRDDKTLNEDQLDRILKVVGLRLQGIPVAYIVGVREFWSLPLEVNEHVLIPRPETELLVEQVLSLVEQTPNARILELGTGSGAISIALASEVEQLQITASDKCPEALRVAKDNYESLKSTHHSSVAEVDWVLSSWFDNIESKNFDVICSNPPYIGCDDPHLKQGDLRYEPKIALVSGTQGLDDIRIIVTQSANHLKEGGWLVLEHGFEQGLEVRGLFEENGFSQIQTFKDLAGLDRVTEASFGNPVGL